MKRQKEVTTFHITESIEVDGVRVHRLLTRKPIYSRWQLRKALKRIRKTHPEAKGWRGVFLY